MIFFISFSSALKLGAPPLQGERAIISIDHSRGLPFQMKNPAAQARVDKALQSRQTLNTA